MLTSQCWTVVTIDPVSTRVSEEEWRETPSTKPSLIVALGASVGLGQLGMLTGKVEQWVLVIFRWINVRVPGFEGLLFNYR